MSEKEIEHIQSPSVITPIASTTSIRTDNRFSSLIDQTSESSEEIEEEIVFEETERNEINRMSEGTQSAKETEQAIKIQYTLNEDLEDLLRDIFEIDPEDSNHELIEALAFDGVTSWGMFRRLRSNVVESLSKRSVRNDRVPIGKGIQMVLNVLLDYIHDKIDRKEEDARKITSYNAEEFEDYLEQYYRDKQNEATSNANTPSHQPTGYNGRSRTEKALDNWEKKKLDKTSYDILKDDAKYKIWKESFIAEIKVQGLSRMIDPNFNKKKLLDQFDRELFEKQSNYLWTVLLYALRNPVAEVILGKHRDVSDARTAFLAVDEKMKGKIAQMYDVSDLSKTLRELHISNFTGNRVQFIAHWFETLRQLNKIADAEDRLTFIHIRSQIMTAINTDRDLTNSFTELQEEPDRELATTKLMDHLLEKAMLYDGRDNSQSPNDDQRLKALMHRMGIEEDVELLINKARRNGPPEDCKLPDSLYSSFCVEDKRQWRGLTDDAKRAIVKSLAQRTPTREAYAMSQSDNAYVPPIPPPSGDALLSNDTQSAALHAVNVLRHSIRGAEATLRAIDDQSQALTAMSSITSLSRPPSQNSPQEITVKATESDGKRGHPARIMADDTPASAQDTQTHEQRDQQQRAVHFHGYKQFKHHMIYDHDIENDVTSSESVTYNVTKRNLKHTATMALADRGANGCVGGDDCNWIGGPTIERRVHITGMGDHQICNIKVGTIGAYATSNRGPVICIFNETAYVGRGQSILSSIQMEHYKNRVDDRVMALGGGQQITTADGYNFPLSFINGLPYLQMRKFTNKEYESLPHVIMTSEEMWNPRLYDNYVDPDSNEYKQANPINNELLPYDDYNAKGEYIGTNSTETNEDNDPFQFWLTDHEYQHAETVARCSYTARVANQSIDNIQSELDLIRTNENEINASKQPRGHIASEHDYERLKPYFVWVPTKMIRKTFENSTQYGYTPKSPDGNLFKRWKSPNPAMNIFRLQDDLLTDKVMSNTKAIEGGFKASQVFFGRKSHIIHVEQISKTKSFLRCLQNFVRKWGAPIRILADHISYHASFKILDYLRMLWIQLWFSEAYYQHQNPFERRYQTFKRIVNRTMDRTSTPPELWFLCMCHVAYVLNRLADPTLNYRQPIHVATGSIADISALTTFQWLEPLYYKKDVKQITFPDTGEGFGYYVGVAENVGHAMTYKIWKPDTNKVIERSSVRSAWDQRLPNHKAENSPTADVSMSRHPSPPHVGQRVAKFFAEVLHFGTVTKYWIHKQQPLWHIQYDDGDNEDFDTTELDDALRLYEARKSEDPLSDNGNNTATSDTSPGNGETISTSPDNGETSKFEKPTDFIFSENVATSNRPGTPISPHSSNYGERAYLEHTGSMADEIATSTHDIIYNDQGSPMVILTDVEGNPKLDSMGQAILIPGKDPKDIQGISFKHPQDDGAILRARVLGPDESNLHSTQGDRIANRFRIKYDRTQVEDTMSYNDIVNYIHREQVEEDGIAWRFRRIIGHRPVSTRDPHYKRSSHNVTVEWENGEITEESLDWMMKEDPIPLTQYAIDNNLLEEEGWRRLKRLAKRKKVTQRLIKQAKLRSFRTAPKYMYGFQVPRDFREALEFDERNGNTRWADATELELSQLHDYQVFIDKGMFHQDKLPVGYKKIRVHLVYAVKHDGRHKARMVADGHLTDIPLNSVYAGVVSIRGLRMCIFIAELNGLEAYATDIGNAYLEAITQEKVCIKAGPEFGDLEGHLLLIHKALYGLRSSGKEFGDLLASCLRELGFIPSKAEPQIFLRRGDGDTYEYVATYVDDLCLVMKDPIGFLKILQSEPYNFKLKGSGPMQFHLGCGFERDQMGTLCMNPIKYIQKMEQAYEQLFGVKPSTKPKSPLEEGDHPELDTSEFLDFEDTQKYQSLIGSLQWLITLGRWDIQTAVMTLSSFRAKPRKGHLLRARRLYGYIRKFKHYKIRYRVSEPDLSDLDGAAQVDWSKDVYGETAEQLPEDAPEPLGRKVTLIHWFDANLMHDTLSGKAVTGCIHFANKTPIMWYSKKQATSETATYGAEFCAGRTCIEQIIDLRNSFRYLGVPVHDISYVFGDNKSMIDSATYPYARLHKRHNILSYHYVRSMIARGFISMTHTNSDSNLADIVTKHWGYNSVKGLLKPVFDYMGNTGDLLRETE